MNRLFIFFLLFTFCSTAEVMAQDTGAVARKDSAAGITADTAFAKAVKKFNPRTATIRSAIFPGLGQIYNKKYWKLPLVWGALGTTAGVYIYNVKEYRLLKQAYIYLSDTISANNALVDPRFRNLSKEAIRSYRNSFRQNVDYSVIFFLLFWGLNVVDATVDAHLKAFDVNDNLSLYIKPGYSEMAHTSGISLVLAIGKHNKGR